MFKVLLIAQKLNYLSPFCISILTLLYFKLYLKGKDLSGQHFLLDSIIHALKLGDSSFKTEQ